MIKQGVTEIVNDDFSNDDYDSPWKEAVEHYFPELKVFQEIDLIERR